MFGGKIYIHRSYQFVTTSCLLIYSNFLLPSTACFILESLSSLTNRSCYRLQVSNSSCNSLSLSLSLSILYTSAIFHLSNMHHVDSLKLVLKKNYWAVKLWHILHTHFQAENHQCRIRLTWTSLGNLVNRSNTLSLPAKCIAASLFYLISSVLGRPLLLSNLIISPFHMASLSTPGSSLLCSSLELNYITNAQ